MYREDFHARYRPNVGVALMNKDGRVFFGRRVQAKAMTTEYANRPNEWRWQMPQGGVDDGEAIADAAFRELREETGVTSARLLTITPSWLAYDFPAGYRKRDWIGQRQKWAAMLFEGVESEIDLCAVDHQEFDEWRWGELEEAPSLIVPFKRDVYDAVMEAFVPLRDFIRSSFGQRAISAMTGGTGNGAMRKAVNCFSNLVSRLLVPRPAYRIATARWAGRSKIRMRSSTTMSLAQCP